MRKLLEYHKLIKLQAISDVKSSFLNKKTQTNKERDIMWKALAFIYDNSIYVWLLEMIDKWFLVDSLRRKYLVLENKWT